MHGVLRSWRIRMDPPARRMRTPGFDSRLFAQLAEQPQDFEVQPHQRDGEREGAIPLHVLRRARSTPCLMMSKSRIRFSAAMTTTKPLNRMPNVPPSWMKPMGLPNMLMTMLMRYSSAMPPVAAITPTLNFSVAWMSPDRYANSITAITPKVRHNGLHDDAGIGDIENRRQTADQQTLEQRVDRRRDGSPLRFEYGDQADDEAADGAGPDQRHDRRGILSAVNLPQV